MFTPTNHVIAGPDLHRAGPLALWGFSQIFLPNIGEEKKKVSPSERAIPAPRGAYRGRARQLAACALPNENCAPPSEDCAPKKLTVSGLLECNSRPKLVFFVH